MTQLELLVCPSVYQLIRLVILKNWLIFQFLGKVKTTIGRIFIRNIHASTAILITKNFFSANMGIKDPDPANIYLFKVNKRNTIKEKGAKYV